jgi:hypothetical protein
MNDVEGRDPVRGDQEQALVVQGEELAHLAAAHMTHVSHDLVSSHA